MKRYLAVDLGAESGRVMLGTLVDSRKLTLEEIHRFANPVRKANGHLHWDLAHLEKEIVAGLKKAGAGEPVAGISTDSWGVDYVLLDAEGKPLAPPYCYRDERTLNSTARFFAHTPFATVYEETGIQLMNINTLFQLEAESHDAVAELDSAAMFLTIADYFNARFSGVRVIEESLASTTQIYNPRTKAWSEKLIAALKISPQLFPKVVRSGTVLGPVTDGELKSASALAGAKVVATCSHDTGAAVAAVPADSKTNPQHDSKTKWAYLSSGTWSLLGVELERPIITEQAREAGFTNEVGLGGTIRLLKNIAGLWVLQETRRAWAEGGKEYSYDDLTKLARESGPAQAHLSLDDPRFVSAGQMPEKIAAFCRETGQPVPDGPGATARVILESLALTYREMLGRLEKLTGDKIERLHIVGGGSRNELLNQLAADATGVAVIAGPVEATAIGNILIQALALGHIASPEQLRQIVAQSFPTKTYQPGTGISDEAWTGFQKLGSKS